MRNLRARPATWGRATSAVVTSALLAAALPGALSAQAGTSDVCADPAPTATEIATARLYVEYNATDDDVGVHGAFDDSGWSSLCVLDPAGQPILVVDPQSQLNDLTMAGIFFESREPPADEFSVADLMAAYPEGAYSVRGLSYDGTPLTGEAIFGHDIPLPPEIVSPALAEDEEATREAVVPMGDLTVAWQPVTESVNGDPIVATAYEVIVTKVDHDDPNGFSQPIYDVHVPAPLGALIVPAGFLEPGTVYELEILALEETGNQTISVGFFETDAAATAAAQALDG